RVVTHIGVQVRAFVHLRLREWISGKPAAHFRVVGSEASDTQPGLRSPGHAREPEVRFQVAAQPASTAPWIVGVARPHVPTAVGEFADGPKMIACVEITSRDLTDVYLYPLFEEMFGDRAGDIT